MTLAAAFGGASVSAAAAQRAPQRAERQAILDAVRPLAAARTHQPVRIVVARLNQAGDWAVLEGELVDTAGRSLDWSRAEECEPELDKGLWAELQRVQGMWRVRALTVCAPEPPYWDAEFFTRSRVPCNVLSGLSAADGADLATTCRRSPRAGSAGFSRATDSLTRKAKH